MGKTKLLKVPGKIEYLDTLAGFVLQAADEANLDYRSSYRLRLAVDEIATNIILYGLVGAEVNTLTLTAKTDEDYLTICLEDKGTGYNPYEALTPPKKCRLSNSNKVGGWGIYLAIRGVDEFLYERERGKNRSTFRMQRPFKTH